MKDESGRVETVRVTPNHPYLVAANDNDVPKLTQSSRGILDLVRMDPGGDWTAVLKLKPGDELVSAFGVPLVVDSIDVDDAPTRVYSLEVEGLHSFAVGQLAAWVHNIRFPRPPSPDGAAGPPGPLPNVWKPTGEYKWKTPCGCDVVLEKHKGEYKEKKSARSNRLHLDWHWEIRCGKNKTKFEPGDAIPEKYYRKRRRR